GASSYAPVASRTTRVGGTRRTRLSRASMPRSSFDTTHDSLVGRVATTSSAFATSMPMNTDGAVAMTVPPLSERFIVARPCKMRAWPRATVRALEEEGAAPRLRLGLGDRRLIELPLLDVRFTGHSTGVGRLN